MHSEDLNTDIALSGIQISDIIIDVRAIQTLM